MKMYMRVQPNRMLAADDTESAEYMNTLKLGEVVTCDVRKPRNYQFHKKYFALLQLGFDYFEPENNTYKGVPVEKNFERFRHDVTIMAGYYTFVNDIRGNPKAQAKSISFGSMSQEEFEKLYSKTVDVLLKYVMKNYTEDQLRIAVDQIVGFV